MLAVYFHYPCKNDALKLMLLQQFLCFLLFLKTLTIKSSNCKSLNSSFFETLYNAVWCKNLLYLFSSIKGKTYILNIIQCKCKLTCTTDFIISVNKTTSLSEVWSKQNSLNYGAFPFSFRLKNKFEALVNVIEVKQKIIFMLWHWIK